MRALLLPCVMAGALCAAEPGYKEVFDPFDARWPLTGNRLDMKKRAFERAASRHGLVALPKHMRKWEDALEAIQKRIERDHAIYLEAGEKWWGFKHQYAESYKKKHGRYPVEAPLPPNNEDFLDKEKALKASQSLKRRERAFHDYVEARAAELLNALEPPKRAKAVAAFASGLKDRNPHHRVRCAATLGSAEDLKAAEVLVRAATSEKEFGVAAAMVRACARAGGTFEMLGPFLQHDAWPVRAAAIRGMEQVRTKEAVEALVDRFAQERGRLLDDLAFTLRALTNRQLGGDGAAWKAWWEGAKDGFTVLPARPEPEQDLSVSHGVPSDGAVSLGGVATRSERILFCLDGRFPELWLEAVAECIGALPDGGAFGIVVFGEEAKPWRKKMSPAIPGNRKAAVEWLRKLEQERRGDVVAGVEAAFALAGAKRGKEPLADTMYLVAMTGGGETVRIPDPPQIAQEVVAANRIVGIRIHPLGKSTGADAWWLQTIARQFDGVYVPP